MRRPDTSASRVLSAHGDKAWIDGTPACIAQLKGRSLKPVAGDWVRVDWNETPPVIVDVLTARNALMRSEGTKTKLLAANVDLAVLVVSGHPIFSPDLMLRVLASLYAADIPVVIALNKVDLAAPLALARQVLRDALPALTDEEGAAPPVVACCEISATSGDGHEGIAPLLREIAPRLSRLEENEETAIALIGQSGMGKSSLLNRLIPQAEAETREISQALQTGRHTTTVSRAYRWPGEPTKGQPWVIDTPGFQRFGIAHLSQDQVAETFPEWSILQKRQTCRFYNCRHSHEPGCGVKAGIADFLARNPECGKHLEQRRQYWLSLAAGTQT